MKNKFTEYLGWYGVMAILAAYACISYGFFDAQSLPYQLLNLSGALAIMYQSYKKKDMQPVVLNIIWAAIALAATLQIIL